VGNERDIIEKFYFLRKKSERKGVTYEKGCQVTDCPSPLRLQMIDFLIPTFFLLTAIFSWFFFQKPEILSKNSCRVW
jgi:hypothetical protein